MADDTPTLPCRARISAFHPLDEVGTLVLANGTPAAFGRSACDGFTPVQGAAVTVLALARQAGGLRATRIESVPPATAQR